MKVTILTFLASLVAASPCQAVPALSCITPGIKGAVTGVENGGPKFYTFELGKGNVADCRKLCYSPEQPQCRSFAIRENSNGGACYLYDTDISSSIKPRDGTSYTYFALPAGIKGWVPENVAQHYFADTTKTKGTYTACRGLCLSQTKCLGFGYKEGGNCQLYDVSLAGKVKPAADSPYIQWQMDCRV